MRTLLTPMGLPVRFCLQGSRQRLLPILIPMPTRAGVLSIRSRQPRPRQYRQQGAGNLLNPAVSFNPNSPEISDSTSQRLPVVLLIIGIVIALAYLVFLLLVLVKPDILSLAAFPSQPVSITADVDQLLASSFIGLW